VLVPTSWRKRYGRKLNERAFLLTLAARALQPALVRYMVECIFEAGDDDGEPIEIDAEAQGELFLVLKT
jgi:hypothetical protein